MKYVLLIMTVMQVKTFWRSLKGIFESHGNDIEKIHKSIDGMDKITKDEDLTNLIIMVVSIVYGTFLSVYYMFAEIVVGSLIFAIISCYMIVKSWRDISKAIKWLSDRDNEVIQRRPRDRVWSALYLSYIGYLVYFLVTNW